VQCFHAGKLKRGANKESRKTGIFSCLPASLVELFPPLKQMARKCYQPGKFVAWINIFLDDVKREIIKPAETPDRHREQHGGLQRRTVEKNQNGGDQADEKEKNSFELDPKRTRQVFHKKFFSAKAQQPQSFARSNFLRALASLRASLQTQNGFRRAPGRARFAERQNDLRQLHLDDFAPDLVLQ
jgi:hypothetical protein